MKDDNLRSALYGSLSLPYFPQMCEMDARRWIRVHVSLKLTTRGGRKRDTRGFDLICTCTPETKMNPEYCFEAHSAKKNHCFPVKVSQLGLNKI